NRGSSIVLLGAAHRVRAATEYVSGSRARAQRATGPHDHARSDRRSRLSQENTALESSRRTETTAAPEMDTRQLTRAQAPGACARFTRPVIYPRVGLPGRPRRASPRTPGALHRRRRPRLVRVDVRDAAGVSAWHSARAGPARDAGAVVAVRAVLECP